jgi:hypothetical protein
METGVFRDLAIRRNGQCRACWILAVWLDGQNCRGQIDMLQAFLKAIDDFADAAYNNVVVCSESKPYIVYGFRQ